MSGYLDNIEEITVKNESFRRVLYTARKMQLVVMSLQPGEDIGVEVHPDVDQFFRIEEGEGQVVMDGVARDFKADDAIIIPQGTEHNIINTSSTKPLKLYTIYTPPNHPDGKVHKTREEAMQDEHDHA